MGVAVCRESQKSQPTDEQPKKQRTYPVWHQQLKDSVGELIQYGSIWQWQSAVEFTGRDVFLWRIECGYSVLTLTFWWVEILLCLLMSLPSHHHWHPCSHLSSAVEDSLIMVRYLCILALVATGTSAFFFQPAVPVQEGPKISAAEGLLDNPSVASDPNIHPSRKCGFCMGWAGQTNCPVSGL